MFGFIEREEKVATIIRKHWLVYIIRVGLLILAGLIPLLIASFVPAVFREQVAALPHADAVLTFAFMLYLLLLWILAFILWTNYYLDIWVVTDKRIIDVNQRRLFYRDITTLRLEKIQDVSVDVSGILATLFHFGKITIHTAGDNEDIVIKNAGSANEAKEQILAVHNRVLEKPMTVGHFH